MAHDSLTRRSACLFVLTLVTAAACSGGGHKQVPITFGGQNFITVSRDGRTLFFSVPTSNGKPSVRVVESARDVHLLVSSDTSNSNKCADGVADGVSVTLQHALGARTVIDDKSGSRVETLAEDYCAVTGERRVVVPSVVGRALRDAVRLIRARGLHVVGDGLPPGDPAISTAVVLAQKPGAGERVPRGACVGFRTRR